MRIILIRHGESQANVDQSLHQTLPDHEISLSSRGQIQAEVAAEQIYKFYVDKYGEGHTEHMSRYKSHKVMLWNSPYRRTRDTAKIIKEHLPFKKSLVCREDILLCEQQFGLFDGLTDEEIQNKFPEEFKIWNKCREYNGKFWARYPMGESPFDAAVRIHHAFGGIHRVKKNENISDHIVVCHGTVVKLFIMMWFRYSPEWFNEQPTIGNCGLYLIEDKKDAGIIFPGYKRGRIPVACR